MAQGREGPNRPGVHRARAPPVAPTSPGRSETRRCPLTAVPDRRGNLEPAAGARRPANLAIRRPPPPERTPAPVRASTTCRPTPATNRVPAKRRSRQGLPALVDPQATRGHPHQGAPRLVPRRSARARKARPRWEIRCFSAGLHLGERATLAAVRCEDRVVAEPGAADRLSGDDPGHLTLGPHLAPVGKCHHGHGAEPRPPVFGRVGTRPGPARRAAWPRSSA